jgi:hypothetical protein
VATKSRIESEIRVKVDGEFVAVPIAAYQRLAKNGWQSDHTPEEVGQMYLAEQVMMGGTHGTEAEASLQA